jgi:hypothetical protein
MSFCLKPKQKKKVLKLLKFSDGYTAGLRQAMNVKTWKLSGLKSHDYLIIIKARANVLCFRGVLEARANVVRC